MRELNSLNQSLNQVRAVLAPREILLKQKDQLTSLQSIFEDIKKKFNNVGSPPEGLALKAATRFLAGDSQLDDVDIDLIAFALAKPISSDERNTIFNNGEKLRELLDIYSARCASGIDMLITWRGVMSAYFELSPDTASDRIKFERSLEDIRRFLSSTWNSVRNSSELRLSWMKVIDENVEILGTNPCNQYAKQWFDGNEDLVLKISSDLQISSKSWFWERLFITCLQSVLNFDEFGFKKSIPKLLELFEKHKIYRDKGLMALLDRYALCSDTGVNEVLKEYALDLWGSPEGHELAGSRWKLISDPALSMVINWVHETNLRVFIELLKDRGYAKDERLNFWLKYISQVKSSKLVLGPTSRAVVNSRPDLRKIFKQAGNSYSELRDDKNSDNDAFLMTIGNHLIVDFSIEGGCYVYKQGQHNFSITNPIHYAETFKGGLKEKYRTEGMDFAHNTGWTDSHRAPKKLREKYGITPSSNRNTTTPSKSQSIDVGNYFTGVASANGLKTTETQAPSIEASVPVFTSLHSPNVNPSAPPNKPKELFNYFSAKNNATQIAQANGIEYLQSGSRFIVRLPRENGPIAKQFQDIGLKYISGIGWVLE